MSNGDDYAASQDDRSRRYNDAYKAWFNALSESERAALKKQGLDRPDDGRHIPTPGSYDITEMQLGESDEGDDRSGHADAFEFDEPVAEAEIPGEEPASAAVTEAPRHADRWREVGELLMILLDAKDTRYVASLVALAAGCDGMLTGVSEREIAVNFKVSHPNIRGSVRAIRARLSAAAPGGEPDWDFVARTVTLIISQPSARLSAECFCLAADLGGFLVKDSGGVAPSQADLARKHKCTRAAVSKRVKTFSERLMLRPCGSMRKLELCEKYRAARHRRVELERTTLVLG